MNREHYLRGVVVAALCSASTVFAQSGGYINNGVYDPATPERRGRAGMTFVQIGASARAEGMGGAFAGVRGDPATAFYNPAGIADITKIAVSADHTKWVADMALEGIVAAGRVSVVSLAASFLSMDYGSFEGTRVVDNRPEGFEPIGMVTPIAWALGGIVAAKLTDRFNAGVQVKWLVQDIDETEVYTFRTPPGYTGESTHNRVSTWAIDLGTQYYTGLRNLSVNMALQNFGGTQKFAEVLPNSTFSLPLTYRVGVSSELMEMVTGDANGANKLFLSLEGVDRRNVSLDGAVGLEYAGDMSSFVPGLAVALRAGRRPARTQEGWMSFGGGLSVPLAGVNLGLDYSYNDYGPKLAVQRVGIKVNLQ
jgi:hypothetical protein